MGGYSGVYRILGLAILGAFYLFWSDIKSPLYTSPVSIADAACAKLWVARAQNGPALACYLQQKTARLCDPSEREHLNWVFQRYAQDKKAFGQDMLLAVTSVGLLASVKQVKNPDGDSVAALNSAGAAIAKDLKATGIAAAMKVEMVPRKELVAMLKKIVNQGLIQEADFGWSPDSLVLDAFAGIESAKIIIKRTCN